MGLKEKHQRLYDMIPDFKCKQCGECCGPIPMTKWERNNRPIQKEINVIKMLESRELNCPHLVNNKCEIYKQRPLLCRMFGTVKPMPCPNNCRPDRMVTEEEAREIKEGYDELMNKKKI